MQNKETTKRYLAARIERWMESGEPALDLNYMLPAVNGDLALLSECLSQWQSEGKVDWLGEFDLNKPDVPVVRFGRFPLSNVLWPPPLDIAPMEQAITVDLYNDGRFVGRYPRRQRSFIEKYMPSAKIVAEEE